MNRARWLVMLLLLMLAPMALAEESEALKKRKVSRTAGLSQQVYGELQEIQALVEADQIAEAEDRLLDLQQRKLNEYELSQSWFIMGYVKFQQEDFAAAQSAYEEVLKNENLPLGMQTNVYQTLAQLSMVNEKYAQALDYLDKLLAIAEEPQPGPYALKAQAHYQMEQFDESMAAIVKAEEIAAQRGSTPREGWLLLKNAILYQREDYDGMLEVVQQLVRLYPKDRYLLNMAAIYGEMGNSKKQLSLMEPLYERGSLATESQKVNLASLYMLHEIPHKAAVLLEREINRGDVEATHKHWEMLAQARLMAANIELALEPLQEAAVLADDGDTYLTLARTQMGLSRWSDAEASVDKALAKGGLRDEAAAHLLKGMAQFNQKKYRDARTAFAKAGEDPSSEKLAKQWMDYLAREEEKLALAREAAQS